MSGPEELQNSQETGIETRNASFERLEQLKTNPENTVELSPRDIEAKAEKARNDALEKASSIESAGKNNKKSEKHSQSMRRSVIGKTELNASYKNTMKQVRSELPASGRTFSKVIHSPLIEKSSDVIGSTIARPNAMLSGAVAAFVLTLIIYTIAKTLGYPLSGSETIIAFVVGWVVGVLFDYFRVLFTGKK